MLRVLRILNTAKNSYLLFEEWIIIIYHTKILIRNLVLKKVEVERFSEIETMVYVLYTS